MKKNLIIIIGILLVAILISGCSQNKPANGDLSGGSGHVDDDLLEEDIGKESLTIDTYYPFKENQRMVYEGIGNEFAEKETFLEYIDGNKAQIKIVSPATTFAKVLIKKDGELKEVYEEGEFYHIENMMNASVNTNRVLLKEPIEVGNSWTDEENNPIEISDLSKPIQTPYGEFNALEVTTKYHSGALQRDYYAKDIGLVASEYIHGDAFDTKTLLKDIVNGPESLEIRVQYPDYEGESIETEVREVSFNTNDNMIEILEDLMMNPLNNSFGVLISENTKINNIYLDRSRWVLEADFTSDLISDMSYGSYFEAIVLKALVNTLGDYYDVDKVYLSVESSPYESGHFMLKEGEYFEVNNDI